jgi:hypothetical protein
MNMNISTHMAAFIETHGGLDLGEFYKWFKGDSPEEIIHTYNSMLLAKYNKEMRGKLEKFDVEKEVSSIKEQLESLPSGESLHETIGGLSQVEKDVCSIKEQLKSLPSLPNLQTVVGGLSLVEESYTELVGGLSRVDDDVSSIKEQLETLPSLPDLQTIGGVLSLVKNDVFSIKAQLKSLPSLPNLQTVVGGLSRVEEDVSSIEEQLKSIPSVETLQSTVIECISLKDIVECMCKTIDVLINENRRISSLIDKPSTVSDHQREWAALTVCYNDLDNFIKKEWAGKQLKIGHIKYECRQFPSFWVYMEPLNTRDGPEAEAEMELERCGAAAAEELSMDEFLLSIERLFKINIPSIYDDVRLELRIKDVSVRTGTQPFLEIPTRTVGQWLKEIREFPGKLRANPDSSYLIKRKEIIPPVIFYIIIFMVGGRYYSLQGEDLLHKASVWADHKKGHLVAEANKCKLAWQRELVK